MTDNIYPSYYELGKSAPLRARKALIKAYEERQNISEVARLFHTTRKTVRKEWYIRFISYSCEKTFTNGLMFMMLVIYFVRSLR